MPLSCTVRNVIARSQLFASQYVKWNSKYIWFWHEFCGINNPCMVLGKKGIARGTLSKSVGRCKDGGRYEVKPLLVIKITI
jgi:hypothetical protein